MVLTYKNNEKMKKEAFDLTPLMVKIFLWIVDVYLACDPSHKVSDLLYDNTEYERRIIKGLYDRAYKENPYKTMTIMELILDSERTKIKRIVHKK